MTIPEQSRQNGESLSHILDPKYEVEDVIMDTSQEEEDSETEKVASEGFCVECEGILPV